MQVHVEKNQVRVGERFSITFQRTLRIPDDGQTYPLPPGLGLLPVEQVTDMREMPSSWRDHSSVFIPMYQREALWLGFDGMRWKPNAVQIAVGGVNAVSGAPWEEGLSASPQNYIVCPLQPWLDGINAGLGLIRQFVAMPLGSGYTVEGQLTDKEELGGIQIRIYEPKPGHFPDQPPPSTPGAIAYRDMAPMPESMGLAAGGKIQQKIYPDPHGLDTWDTTNFSSVVVYIVNSEQYRELTGREPPPTPISPKTYTDCGLPWFDLYDEFLGDIPPGQRLAGVKSIRELAAEQGDLLDTQEEEHVKIDPGQVKKLNLPDA